jgi:hypothetical protein
MTKLNMVKLINRFNLLVNSIMLNWPKTDLPFLKLTS